MLLSSKSAVWGAPKGNSTSRSIILCLANESACVQYEKPVRVASNLLFINVYFIYW